MTRVSEKSCSEYGNSPGRPRKLGLRDSENLVLMYYKYPVSIRELSKKFNVSTMTAWRVLKDQKFVDKVLGFRGD